MKLIDYLDARMTGCGLTGKQLGVRSLSRKEAELMGIRWPLRNGWIKKHAHVTVPQSLVDGIGSFQGDKKNDAKLVFSSLIAAFSALQSSGKVDPLCDEMADLEAAITDLFTHKNN